MYYCRWENYVVFKAQNSITLASMAKQTFGGQISDRDMQIMKSKLQKCGKAPHLWQG